MIGPPIELQPAKLKQDIATVTTRPPSTNTPNDPNPSDLTETLPSPATASAPTLETWKSPRINLYRLLAIFWAFTIMGMNDATYGAIIPYLESHYSLSYTIVSLVFLSPFVGYNLAAALNNTIHLRLGQRGVATLGPLCHVLAYLTIALHPPYPLLVLSFILAGLGNGLLDSGWNAHLSALPHASELLGLLHAFYGLGATTAPLLATTLLTHAHTPWHTWYYILLSLSVLELATSTTAFRSATAPLYRASHPSPTPSLLRTATLQPPHARTTWLTALFLLGYVGIEVALGGWLVVFTTRVRHSPPFASGMVATGFWLGITAGRVVLGFATPRLGLKRSIVISLSLATTLHLIFWLVPNLSVSAAAVAGEGVFLGPMFPVAVVVMTRLLPRELHVSGIGFAAAFGGSGGAGFPFLVGLVAQGEGVGVLGPVVLGLLGGCLGVWVGLPRLGGERGDRRGGCDGGGDG